MRSRSSTFPVERRREPRFFAMDAGTRCRPSLLALGGPRVVAELRARAEAARGADALRDVEGVAAAAAAPAVGLRVPLAHRCGALRHDYVTWMAASKRTPYNSLRLTGAGATASGSGTGTG